MREIWTLRLEVDGRPPVTSVFSTYAELHDSLNVLLLDVRGRFRSLTVQRSQMGEVAMESACDTPAVLVGRG